MRERKRLISSERRENGETFDEIFDNLIDKVVERFRLALFGAIRGYWDR